VRQVNAKQIGLILMKIGGKTIILESSFLPLKICPEAIVS